MRAYELLKETFSRKLYIGIVHITWLAFYGLTYVLFVPEAEQFGQMLWLSSGCLLPLLLSTGIIGQDISSGRIRTLVTKPFWPGKIYLYRLLGLSLQGAVHLTLAGILLILLGCTAKSPDLNIWLWLFSSWLLFNVWAALATAVSVIVPRGYNSLVLFVALILLSLVVGIVAINPHLYPGGRFYRTEQDHPLLDFIRYACPPFALLSSLARGKLDLIKEAIVIGHSFLLVWLYSAIGLLLFVRRQFTSQRN